MRSSRRLLVATDRTARQMPLEDRAGLSPTQRRTRPSSRRRPTLARGAPSCDDGHGRARLPHSGDLTRQKKLLGGPCRGRDVRFNISCSPGLALALTVAPLQGALAVHNTLNVVILDPPADWRRDAIQYRAPICDSFADTSSFIMPSLLAHIASPLNI